MFSDLRNRTLFALLLLLIFAAVLGVMHNRAASQGRSLAIESGTRMILKPLQVVGYKIGKGAGAFFQIFRTRSSLLKENKMLRSEVRRLSRDNSILIDASRENESLRRELDFKSSSPLPLITARVISRETSGWFSTCVIDRGSLKQLKPGLAVCTDRGLVGQIDKTSPTSSTVILLSDATSAVGAMDQRSRVAGICRGQSSDTLSLEYLPKESDVKVGDIILSSGVGQLVPKGLPIGRVMKVEPDPGGFMKHALLRPSASVDQLEDVFVVVRVEEE